MFQTTNQSMTFAQCHGMSETSSELSGQSTAKLNRCICCIQVIFLLIISIPVYILLQGCDRRVGRIYSSSAWWLQPIQPSKQTWDSHESSGILIILSRGWKSKDILSSTQKRCRTCLCQAANHSSYELSGKPNNNPSARSPILWV